MAAAGGAGGGAAATGIAKTVADFDALIGLTVERITAAKASLDAEADPTGGGAAAVGGAGGGGSASAVSLYSSLEASYNAEPKFRYEWKNLMKILRYLDVVKDGRTKKEAATLRLADMQKTCTALNGITEFPPFVELGEIEETILCHHDTLKDATFLCKRSLAIGHKELSEMMQQTLAGVAVGVEDMSFLLKFSPGTPGIPALLVPASTTDQGSRQVMGVEHFPQNNASTVFTEDENELLGMGRSKVTATDEGNTRCSFLWEHESLGDRPFTTSRTWRGEHVRASGSEVGDIFGGNEEIHAFLETKTYEANSRDFIVRIAGKDFFFGDPGLLQGKDKAAVASGDDRSKSALVSHDLPLETLCILTKSSCIGVDSVVDRVKKALGESVSANKLRESLAAFKARDITPGAIFFPGLPSFTSQEQLDAFNARKEIENDILKCEMFFSMLRHNRDVLSSLRTFCDSADKSVYRVRQLAPDGIPADITFIGFCEAVNAFVPPSFELDDLLAMTLEEARFTCEILKYEPFLSKVSGATGGLTIQSHFSRLLPPDAVGDDSVYKFFKSKNKTFALTFQVKLKGDKKMRKRTRKHRRNQRGGNRDLILLIIPKYQEYRRESGLPPWNSELDFDTESFIDWIDGYLSCVADDGSSEVILLLLEHYYDVYGSGPETKDSWTKKEFAKEYANRVLGCAEFTIESCLLARIVADNPRNPELEEEEEALLDAVALMAATATAPAAENYLQVAVGVAKSPPGSPASAASSQHQTLSLNASYAASPSHSPSHSQPQSQPQSQNPSVHHTPSSSLRAGAAAFPPASGGSGARGITVLRVPHAYEEFIMVRPEAASAAAASANLARGIAQSRASAREPTDLVRTAAREAGYTVVEVEDDGECFFNAVGAGLFNVGVRTYPTTTAVRAALNQQGTHWGQPSYLSSVPGFAPDVCFQVYNLNNGVLSLATGSRGADVITAETLNLCDGARVVKLLSNSIVMDGSPTNLGSHYDLLLEGEGSGGGGRSGRSAGGGGGRGASFQLTPVGRGSSSSSAWDNAMVAGRQRHLPLQLIMGANSAASSSGAATAAAAPTTVSATTAAATTAAAAPKTAAAAPTTAALKGQWSNPNMFQLRATGHIDDPGEWGFASRKDMLDPLALQHQADGPPAKKQRLESVKNSASGASSGVAAPAATGMASNASAAPPRRTSRRRKRKSSRKTRKNTH
jgi:hypothetical protein